MKTSVIVKIPTIHIGISKTTKNLNTFNNEFFSNYHYIRKCNRKHLPIDLILIVIIINKSKSNFKIK